MRKCIEALAAIVFNMYFRRWALFATTEEEN
jgi:hypothetical protein